MASDPRQDAYDDGAELEPEADEGSSEERLRDFLKKRKKR
jgi:hypothetical protein